MSNRVVDTITVITKQSPDGSTWLGQVHVEFEDTKAKDVLKVMADNPASILERARNAIDKRYPIVDGKVVLKS